MTTYYLTPFALGTWIGTLSAWLLYRNLGPLNWFWLGLATLIALIERIVR